MQGKQRTILSTSNDEQTTSSIWKCLTPKIIIEHDRLIELQRSVQSKKKLEKSVK